MAACLAMAKRTRTELLRTTEQRAVIITETRNWEKLPKHCLVNIFRRLEMASMVLDVPFVCKSWYSAALDPLCWHNLNFPDFGRSADFFFPKSPSAAAQAWRLMFTYNFCYEDSFDKFIKQVVDHSQGSATSFNPPSNCSSDALTYISQRCPKLKSICLRSEFMSRQGKTFAELVVNWKDLEVLGVGGSGFLAEILTQIGLHCHKFRSLSCSNSKLCVGEVAAIVKFPRLKYLRIQESEISRPALMMILEQCRELELLELTKCVGFIWDPEIHRLASCIKLFQCRGCTAPIISGPVITNNNNNNR